MLGRVDISNYDECRIPQGARHLRTGSYRPLHVDEISQIHKWTPERAHAATPLIVRHASTIQVAHDLARDGSLRRIGEAARRTVHRLLATWLDERAGNDVTLLLAAARHRKAAGLDHSETIRRILRSSTRRFVGSDGLETIPIRRGSEVI